jgi:hypothetical protein
MVSSTPSFPKIGGHRNLEDTPRTLAGYFLHFFFSGLIKPVNSVDKCYNVTYNPFTA